MNSYITIQSHKEDYLHKILCQMINPSKLDIGKLSTIILHKIKSDVFYSMQVNQSKNSQGLNCLKTFETKAMHQYDAPMGCFDGAEVCLLVGVYILHLSKTNMKTLRTLVCTIMID